jgi:hypothetical protein
MSALPGCDRHAGRKSNKELIVKAHRSALLGLGLSLVLMSPAPLSADGFKNCTKAPKSSWQPASAAEALARTAGYEVRKSKIEGSCYEVYGVKDGKLFELFYSPENLKLIHTKAK